MFAGDTESIYSVDSPDPLKAVPESWMSLREREFGWSGNVSGIRAGEEEKVMNRELEFERMLRPKTEVLGVAVGVGLNEEEDLGDYVKLRKPEWSEENGRGMVSGNRRRRRRRVRSNESKLQIDPRELTSGFKSTQPTRYLEEHHQAYPSQHFRSRSCHGTSRELRKTEKGSQFKPFDLSANETSNSKRKSWLSDKDEELYERSREVKDEKLESKFEMNEKRLRKKRIGITNERNSEVEKVFKRFSRRLTIDDRSYRSRSRRKEEEEIKLEIEGGLYLSHQMVGPSSPYPIRPPLPGFDRLSIMESDHVSI
ncbi:hypothetical protein DFH28DRAFT_276231 [Melampsora americana]|nr:hypothetical protein DFH28DRAFT_276231 [Melampsora americana]